MAMKGTVKLSLASAGGRTLISDCYHTQPFKIMDVTQDRGSGALHLILMSASPGLLDGDEQGVELRLGAGSRLHLATQGFQRLFAMEGNATQHFEATLDRGAHLRYLPHPIVPHRRSSVHSENLFHLANGASLTWGEVLACGRKGSGESFAFTRYSSLTRIYRTGRLVAKERVLLEPALDVVQGLGKLEGFTHQATLFCLDETLEIKPATEALLRVLEAEPRILFGLSALPSDGLSVRLLGQGGEALHALLQRIASCLEAFASTPANR